MVNVSGRVGVNGSEEHGAGSVLCLDTATDWCSVALLDTGTTGIEVKSESALEAGRSHARLLLPMIDRVLGAADIGPDGVAAIVVGCGPGTFTGVRMGVATGRAIALGLGVPIAGVSTLGALAAAATGLGSVGAQGVETLAVCVDARRGELFVAAYRRWRRAHTSDQTHPVSPAPVSPETSVMWHKVGESFACSPSALAREVRRRVPGSEEWAVVCPERSLEDIVESGGFAKVTAADPRAKNLLLGQERLVETEGATGGTYPEWGDPEHVRPIYIRPPDADIHIKKMRDPWQS